MFDGDSIRFLHVLVDFFYRVNVKACLRVGQEEGIL